MQSVLDTAVGWVKAHGSLWAALGLVAVALSDVAAENYSGAAKAVLAAGGLLHLWSGASADAPTA